MELWHLVINDSDFDVSELWHLVINDSDFVVWELWHLVINDSDFVVWELWLLVKKHCVLHILYTFTILVIYSCIR